MTTPDNFVIDIPAGFPHHAKIYDPSDLTGAPRFGLFFPGEAIDPDLRQSLGFHEAGNNWTPSVRVRPKAGFSGRATSNHAPAIMVSDPTAWQSLLLRADYWRIPRDALFTGLAMQAAVSVFHRRLPFQKGTSLALIAVKIEVPVNDDGEPFSPELDRRVAEIKGWFE